MAGELTRLRAWSSSEGEWAAGDRYRNGRAKWRPGRIINDHFYARGIFPRPAALRRSYRRGYGFKGETCLGNLDGDAGLGLTGSARSPERIAKILCPDLPSFSFHTWCRSMASAPRSGGEARRETFTTARRLAPGIRSPKVCSADLSGGGLVSPPDQPRPCASRGWAARIDGIESTGMGVWACPIWQRCSLITARPARSI